MLLFTCSKEKPEDINKEQDNKLAHIYITTQDNKEISSKEDYLKATIKIEGLGNYENYHGDAKIRGRGNSTWQKPKKPYKIKLNEKAGLLGMLPEKDWVLLANYLDPTLMLTATAMKIGQQLNVNYSNHIVPVELIINGEYRGQYNLTEQIEVKENRVNVKGGILLELDSYFDAKYKFKSEAYNLPVNFKYPKKVSSKLLADVKNDFNVLEKLMRSDNFPNNEYGNYFDKEAFVNYFIVYMLTANNELSHPKSTYMHRKADTKKFIMGPLWDFDWAYGYQGIEGSHFSVYNSGMFAVDHNQLPGYKFFKRLLSDPTIVSLIKQKWSDYKKTHFQNLLQYLDKYYEQQKQSRQKDYQKWHTGSGNFDADYKKLRRWLKNRATFIDSYIGTL